MPSFLDITVIIATRNNSGQLRETLRAFTGMEVDGLHVEYVVVDNGSSDDTAAVISEMGRSLPLKYLHEARPGQNCARNRALGEVSLGDIVAFTDDDIEPRSDWLQAMKTVSTRWPDVPVFGGAIQVVWPRGDVPAWAQDPVVANICCGQHHRGDGERLYVTPLEFPCSGNMWFRRRVFQGGRRFDERFGPMPGQRLMGSETRLLHLLACEGLPMLFSPSAVVGHRVERKALQWRSAVERMKRSGRSVVHIAGQVDREALLCRWPVLWSVHRVASVAVAVAHVGLSRLGVLDRVEELRATWRMARDIEMLKVVNQSRRSGRRGLADGSYPVRGDDATRNRLK